MAGTEPDNGRDRRARTRAAVVGLATAALVLVAGLVVISAGSPQRDAASPVATASGGSHPSASATSPGKVRPPGSLKIERGLTTVTLAWEPPDRGAPVDHFEVFRDGKRIAKTEGSGFRDEGRTIGTLYRYWVVTVAQDGRTSRRSFRAVTTRVPPVSEAQLAGTYSVTATLGAHDGTRVRFSSQSIDWSFASMCPAAACDASWRATHRSPEGSVITSGVMRRIGGVYRGTWRGPFISGCRERRLDAISTLTFVIRATGGRVEGGRWVASGISGTIVESVEGCDGVPNATYTF
jgi:hypothetical protein